MANVDYDGQWNGGMGMGLQGFGCNEAAQAQNVAMQHPAFIYDPGHSHGIMDPGHCHGIVPHNPPPMMHPADFERMYGQDAGFMMEVQQRDRVFLERQHSRQTPPQSVLEEMAARQKAEFDKMARDIMQTKKAAVKQVELNRARVSPPPWGRIGTLDNDVNPLKDDPNAGMILRDGPMQRAPILMKAKVPLAVKVVKKALPAMMIADSSPHMRYEAWKTLP